MKTLVWVETFHFSKTSLDLLQAPGKTKQHIHWKVPEVDSPLSILSQTRLQHSNLARPWRCETAPFSWPRTVIPKTGSIVAWDSAVRDDPISGGFDLGLLILGSNSTDIPSLLQTCVGFI